MILLVTYDLKGPASNYAKVYDILKAQEGWSHYLTSTWLVKTTKTPNQLTAEITPLLAPGDRVLVVLVDPKERANGFMPKEAWDWINKAYAEEKARQLPLPIPE